MKASPVSVRRTVHVCCQELTSDIGFSWARGPILIHPTVPREYFLADEKLCGKSFILRRNKY